VLIRHLGVCLPYGTNSYYNTEAYRVFWNTTGKAGKFAQKFPRSYRTEVIFLSGTSQMSGKGIAKAFQVD
jgi:hypothetical protein